MRRMPEDSCGYRANRTRFLLHDRPTGSLSDEKTTCPGAVERPTQPDQGPGKLATSAHLRGLFRLTKTRVRFCDYEANSALIERSTDVSVQSASSKRC